MSPRNAAGWPALFQACLELVIAKYLKVFQLLLMRFHHALVNCGLLALILGQASLAGAETIQLDLRSALERAPQANFQILIGQEAVVSQEQASRVARSGLLPQIQLEAAQSRSMMPITGLNAQFTNIDRIHMNNFEAVLRARLSLFDSGSLDNFRISKLSLQATSWDLQNTVEEILRQITAAYYAHWRNERRLEVIDANLERDQLLLRIARNQQQAGVATSLDVTRAEVRLATNELARLQQETAVLDSALLLKRILDLPMHADLVLAREQMLPAPSSLQFNPGLFSDILDARPDYRSLQTQVEREGLALRSAKRQRLPSVALSGQWGYGSETVDSDLDETWAISLGVSVPVFEGFSIDANKQIAASSLRQRQAALQDLENQIEAEYRLALQQVASTEKQVEVARRARDLNEREYDLERIRFEQGVADNSEVVNAQARLADAEDALVEAQFQYFLARANLARAEGDIRQLVR